MLLVGGGGVGVGVGGNSSAREGWEGTVCLGER